MGFKMREVQKKDRKRASNHTIQVESRDGKKKKKRTTKSDDRRKREKNER